MTSISMTEHFVYVGFWRRAAVALLDLLILSPLVLSYVWIYQWSFRLRTPWPLVVPSAAAYLLTLYFVVRFGGTPGKLILGMRIVDRNGEYLRTGRALIRDLINWLSLAVWVMMLVQVMTTAPASANPSNIKQLGEVYKAYGGLWHDVSLSYGWIEIADVLIISCNRRKRAIHDFLAGSFVITKRSYDAIHAASTSVEAITPT